MVYFLSQSHTYQHSWRLVNQGIWQKYPNPQCAHVISVDVVDRSVNPDTGVLRTERVIGVRQKAPLWILKLLGGSEQAFVREISFVDPSTQRTSVTSINLSLSQYLTVLEQISYSPLPSAPHTQTVFTQSAEIQARMTIWKTMASKLEAWSAERFGDNAEKGRMGFEQVLKALWNDQREQLALAEAHA